MIVSTVGEGQPPFSSRRPPPARALCTQAFLMKAGAAELHSRLLPPNSSTVRKICRLFYCAGYNRPRPSPSGTALFCPHWKSPSAIGKFPVKFFQKQYFLPVPPLLCSFGGICFQLRQILRVAVQGLFSVSLTMKSGIEHGNPHKTGGNMIKRKLL